MFDMRRQTFLWYARVNITWCRKCTNSSFRPVDCLFVNKVMSLNFKSSYNCLKIKFNYDLESILPLGFKLPVFYRPPWPPGARPGAGRFAQELLQELWCREAWKQEQQCTSTLDVCENTTMGSAMAIRKRQYVRAINKHVLAIMGRETQNDPH